MTNSTLGTMSGRIPGALWPPRFENRIEEELAGHSRVGDRIALPAQTLADAIAGASEIARTDTYHPEMAVVHDEGIYWAQPVPPYINRGAIGNGSHDLDLDQQPGEMVDWSVTRRVPEFEALVGSTYSLDLSKTAPGTPVDVMANRVATATSTDRKPWSGTNR